MTAKAWEFNSTPDGVYQPADSENQRVTCDRYGHVINRGQEKAMLSLQVNADLYRLRSFLDSLESRLFTLIHR